MMGVNRVTLVGNLGADPDVKKTASGKTVTLFNLATSRSWINREGQKQQHTEWHRIVVWGKQAETCAEYLAKGRQVYIEGHLQTRSWDDDNGQKRYTTEVVANQVLFLGSPNQSTNQEKSTNQSQTETSYQSEPSLMEDKGGSSSDLPF